MKLLNDLFKFSWFFGFKLNNLANTNICYTIKAKRW